MKKPSKPWNGRKSTIRIDASPQKGVLHGKQKSRSLSSFASALTATLKRGAGKKPASRASTRPDLQRGDLVVKEGGDYFFCGTVVAVFEKIKSPAWRVVAQDYRGILMIFNPAQLRKVSEWEAIDIVVERSLAKI